MTKRLYHDDSYLRTFDATVLAHATVGGKPAIALDRTAFYPEAGGQLGDRGTLGGATVVDTQEQELGELGEIQPGSSGRSGRSGTTTVIVHVIEGDAPAIGATVSGTIDWQRRRQHMAQHTGQHLLSGTLLDRAGSPTASARLGESSLTIDVARDRVPDAELAAAEELANDLIDDDLAIRAWFPDAGELSAIKLRRDPKVTADIRVVAIGDFDFSPCGGTHCARTSQIGSIRIVGSERYKGMTRITFTAGRRGRSELFSRDAVLRGLATRFSCGLAEVPAAIDKLARGADAADTTITQLRNQLADALLATFAGTGRVVAEIPGDPELARSIGGKLVTAGRDAVLAVRVDDGMQLVLFRAAGSSLDCGALFKQLSAKYGGRGGGKADRAEGKLATQIADWPAAIAELT